MSTRNLMPRENEEGNIGTSVKSWLKGWFKDVFVSGSLTDGAHSITVEKITSGATVSSGALIPTTIPIKVGDIYIDTVARQMYTAAGTSSALDWIRQATPDDFNQKAPITTCATITDAVAGSIHVPVTTSRDTSIVTGHPMAGFTDISVISLTLDYTVAVMTFIDAVPNAELTDFMVANTDIGNGKNRLTMSWFGFMPVTLGDGEEIINLEFNYISGATALTWNRIGNACEYANIEGITLNDKPKQLTYIDGSVSSS